MFKIVYSPVPKDILTFKSKWLMILSTTKLYSNQQVSASLKVFSFFLSITCVSNFTFNPLHLAVAVGRYGANFYCSRCDIVYRGSMMIMGGTMVRRSLWVALPLLSPIVTKPP